MREKKNRKKKFYNFYNSNAMNWINIMYNVCFINICFRLHRERKTSIYEKKIFNEEIYKAIMIFIPLIY